MIAIKLQHFGDKLKKRRGQVLETLGHVQTEMRTIDDSKEWIDQASYVSRTRLLDSLIQWYKNESTRIDDALLRLSKGTYGFCVACHGPIAFRHLETAPDAAFCVECQEVRELTESTVMDH